MKYVDEFRDPVKARVLLGEIRKLSVAISRNRKRPLQIMEVCGGHTHSIFRYGIQQMLPDAGGVRARARLPGLRAADGASRRLRGTGANGRR